MFIISNLSGGGAQRVTVNLVNELRKEYDICILTLYKSPEPYQIADGVRVIRFDRFFPNRLLYLGKQLKKRICGLFGSRETRRQDRSPAGEKGKPEKQNPVLAVIRKIFILYATLWVKIQKRKWKPKVTVSMLESSNVVNVLSGGRDRKIASERADPQIIGGRYLKDATFSFERADHVVFQSRWVRNMFSENVRKKSTILMNPVDVPERAAVPAAHKIVTAGRLAEQKNQAMLIRAFRRFAEKHPEYSLEIYGIGPLREPLEKLIRDLGLEGRAHLRGFSRNIHDEIRDAEMFVLSSNFEGLSNALLEAMMMGLPCISTACAGSTEVIRDRENGLLTALKDEDALTGAMLEVAENAELRKKLSEGAAASSAGFRTGHVVSQWKKLIDSMIAEYDHGK